MGMIPDSVSSSPNGDELTRPKGDVFFADRQGGVCSRIQKDSLWVFGFEEYLFESGMRRKGGR
ncbi:MAG: hypothetical protein KatS3mg069_2608 [Meiothermus sp.]|nr:MAG: hypothetical protein KatS3mg069_2608 [Meiothermus sp.]